VAAAGVVGPAVQESGETEAGVVACRFAVCMQSSTVPRTAFIPATTHSTSRHWSAYEREGQQIQPAGPASSKTSGSGGLYWRSMPPPDFLASTSGQRGGSYTPRLRGGACAPSCTNTPRPAVCIKSGGAPVSEPAPGAPGGRKCNCPRSYHSPDLAPSQPASTC